MFLVILFFVTSNIFVEFNSIFVRLTYVSTEFFSFPVTSIFVILNIGVVKKYIIPAITIINNTNKLINTFFLFTLFISSSFVICLFFTYWVFISFFLFLLFLLLLVLFLLLAVFLLFAGFVRVDLFLSTRTSLGFVVTPIIISFSALYFSSLCFLFFLFFVFLLTPAIIYIPFLKCILYVFYMYICSQ